MQRAGYDVGYAGKVHLPHMNATDAGFEYICRDERELLADACAEYIRSKRDRPFFLVASFINPHDICYMAIKDFVQAEGGKALAQRRGIECDTLQTALARPEGLDEEAFFSRCCPPLPANFEPQDDEPEALRFMLEQRPFRIKAREEWNDRRWREHRWAYARLTEMVDAQIGHLLGALRDTGLVNSTLIVFTSDHGDMDASHRMEHKSTLYEEACRIPLIVRPVGGTRGRVDTNLVSNGLDLLPTFCDYAGVRPPEGLEGLSLRPVIDNDQRLIRKSVPIECAIGRALVTDRFKYAVYDMGRSNEQLYDLQSDPFEQRNALADAIHRQTLEDHREAFTQFFAVDERSLDDIRVDAAKA